MMASRGGVLDRTVGALAAGARARTAGMLAGGLGAILQVDYVRPDDGRTFVAPTHAALTPRQLKLAIDAIRAADIDIISLDEAHWRLVEGDFERRFVCFTLDCGYRDSIIHAYQVLRDNDVPLAVAFATDFGSGAGELWWVALERVIDEVAELKVRIDGELRGFICDSLAQKRATFFAIFNWLRTIEEESARRFVREICRGIGLDVAALSQDATMNWQEVRMLIGDPLMSLVAQGVRHVALASLPQAQAEFEIGEALARIETATGVRPRHFAYPFGDATSFGPRDQRLVREMGLKTGLTRIAAPLGPEHVGNVFALPRLPLDKRFANESFAATFLATAGHAVRRLASGGRAA
ncbi:MAG: polysaccharide deacetylase family protein [Rhizobiales bacterium]|nr:polysaccharide deacetylase family protein [Hyphomicrobiales bacterium]